MLFTRPPLLPGLLTMQPHDDAPPIDLDAAVVRSLAKLANGQIMPFADQQPPPAPLADWIAQADLPHTHAVLSLTLRRWHELRNADG